MNDLPAGARERLALVVMPERIRSLPRERRGYPVPAFIDRVADKPDGEPDFRIMSHDFLVRCIKRKLCWICGQPLGRYMTFTIGPMCAVNRNTAEPPGHRECAEYSALVCPFLSNPEMRRQSHHMPEDVSVAGVMIPRNPGVTCLWTTRGYKIWNPGREGGSSPGVLFDIGDPTEVSWWCRGREATRAEVQASIGSGLPLLEEIAAQQGAEALAALNMMHTAAQRYLPMAGS